MRQHLSDGPEQQPDTTNKYEMLLATIVQSAPPDVPEERLVLALAESLPECEQTDFLAWWHHQHEEQQERGEEGRPGPGESVSPLDERASEQELEPLSRHHTPVEEVMPEGEEEKEQASLLEEEIRRRAAQDAAMPRLDNAAHPGKRPERPPADTQSHSSFALLDPFQPRRPHAGLNVRTVGMVLVGLVFVVGMSSLGLLMFLTHSGQPQGSAVLSSPTVSVTPAVGTTLSTYRGHSGEVVNGVAWSPDGQRIASASSDGTVHVWDAATLGNVYIYRGHASLVEAVAWSPSGKRIAAAWSNDKTVQVWDADTGGNVYTYHSPEPEHASVPVEALAWSPDGKRIAVGGNDYKVQVWDADTGGNVFTYRGHSDDVSALAWSPDGKRIASASSDKTVQVWDADTGSNVFTYRGHAVVVHALAWSPDGTRISSGSGDKTVQVWDAANGGNVSTYRGHTDTVWAVAWSPDGKRIASAGYDKTVQVWDAVDGGNVYTYRGHAAIVDAVAWSPDGRRIASGGFDETVQVWQAS